MPDPSNKVSEAYIELTVNGDKVKPDLDRISREIHKELEGVEAKASETTQKVAGSFGKSASAIEENTKKIAAFQAKLTAAIGVVTGITGAVAIASGAFIGFGKRMLEAAKEAGRVRDEIERLNAVIQQLDPSSAVSSIDGLTRQYMQLVEALKSSEVPIEDIQKLWDSLDKSFENAKNQAREISFDDAEKSAVRAANAIKSIRDESASALSPTPEIDAAWKEYSKTLDDIDSQIRQMREAERALFGSGRTNQASEIAGMRRNLEKQARDAANKELDLRLTQVAEEEQIRAKAHHDRIESEKKAAMDIEAEKDRRSQDRVMKEIETLRDGLNSITGDFTTVFNELASGLRDVADATSRLK